MKIRNKKLINIVVIALSVAILGGAAYAFTADGPLAFSGTANVDARLEVSIVNGEVLQHGYENLRPEEAKINSWFGKGQYNADFDIKFVAPGTSVGFMFEIENTGTMDAIVSSDDIVIDTTGDLAGIKNFEIVGFLWEYPAAWGQDVWFDGNIHPELPSDDAITLAPGAKAVVYAYARFFAGWPDLAERDSWPYESNEMQGSLTSTLTLNYEPGFPSN